MIFLSQREGSYKELFFLKSKAIWLVVIAGLLLFGALRLPLEKKLTQELQARGLVPQRGLNLSLREQAGQMGIVAVLGGFRSLIASFLYIKGHIAWENVDWAELEALYGAIFQLSPEQEFYFEQGGWHLAYNAAAFYENTPRLDGIMREYYRDLYVDKGIAVLEQGLRHNPTSARLRENLGDIYSRKKHDPCAAWGYYWQAWLSGNSANHFARFAAYNFADCHASDQPFLAYNLLAFCYQQGENWHVPTLLAKMRALHNELNMPSWWRLPQKQIPDYPSYNSLWQRWQSGIIWRHGFW